LDNGIGIKLEVEIMEKKMEKKQEKKGLFIGFITDGMILAKWMMRLNELSHGIPAGMYWRYVWYEGRGYKDDGGYARARQKVVDQARAQNAKWLFFIDSDVFPPPETITKLMSHGKQITTGIYYMKSSPAQPVIFKEMGDGPYWDFPLESLIEIGGAGLGCTLIDMDVFDAFDKAGLAYFQENWIHTKPDGNKVKVAVGEDHWFFIKSKELGFQPYCDTSILCDHIDPVTRAVFPGEEEVSKIRDRILTMKGRKDIVKKDKELYTVESKKKTIVFYNSNPAKFSGDELEKRGVGGAEGAIISLAKSLAKAFNVIVFCYCPEPGLYDGVKYLDIGDTDFMRKFTTDLLIVVRNTRVIPDLKKAFNIDKLCLWTHDIPESPVYRDLPEAMQHIDKIIVLSDWQKNAIIKQFQNINFKDDIWFKTRNGVNTEYYQDTVQRNPFKMIYSSTPFRGLDVLLEVFPLIKNFVPQAELHIFSSMKVYGDNTPEAEEWKALYDKASHMEGVTYHGTVTRKELAKEMKSSAVLAYPNHYPETFCITAIEAVTSGTPIVTSNLAALSEVVPKQCGILIEGEAHSEEYKKTFVDAVVAVLTHKDMWDMMHDACRGFDNSWEKVAKTWVSELLPEDFAEFSQKSEPNTPKSAVKRNINTPEYWDNQYRFETEKGIDQRSDPDRWKIISQYIKDQDRVLDFGCARGEFLQWLKSVRPNTTRIGIDFSKYATDFAKSVDPSLSVGTELGNWNNLDVITSQHVIEHLDNPETHIRELKSRLKTGGTLILILPINDDEWCEHMTILQITDVIDLLNKFDPCTYKIVQRKNSIRKKKDGAFLEEAIFIVKFGG
jgi:glycosyltransferase involved in cell wall biosynthesis/2-polyprenyl-3-methyl-5-hydroxy-6-metoxy-1,4-benzoquinol methylase